MTSTSQQELQQQKRLRLTQDSVHPANEVQRAGGHAVAVATTLAVCLCCSMHALYVPVCFKGRTAMRCAGQVYGYLQTVQLQPSTVQS